MEEKDPYSFVMTVKEARTYYVDSTGKEIEPSPTPKPEENGEVK
jgi:hypothetical protein